MGFRSTHVKHDQQWEDTSSYVPPLIYVLGGDRTIRGSIKKILGRPENE